MLVIKRHNYIFINYIIILSILSVIKTATTENEMERICTIAIFNESEHKTGYRTIQHYADDDNIELTKAHPFYRTLFFEGKRENLNAFIYSIILELLIIVFSVIVFFNYFIFLCVWAGHCGIFKILTDKQKAKRQKHCKYCSLIIMIIIFVISLALNFIGILFITSFKKAIYLSDCALLRFTNHGLYGMEQNYYGILNLRDSFVNLTYSLKMIDTFYSRMFIYYDEINTKNNELYNEIEECNNLATEEQVTKPNVEADLFDYIKVNYQPIYGPKTDESTMIGKINKKYTEKIKPILEMFSEMKNNFETLKANKDDYISQLSIYDKYFDAMTTMYELLNTHVVKIYNSYTETGKVISTIALVAYYIFPILIISLIIFVFIYICKKETTQIIKTIRIIIHVLWNFIFIFSALSLILSCYIGTYRKYSYNLIASFNHIISKDVIKNKTSEDNLFTEIADNPNTKPSLELFNLCYNSSQSTNLAFILDIQDSFVYNFDKLCSNYDKLLNYVYHNNLNEDLTAFINEKKNILDMYLRNITMTTSYETHSANDVNILIQELNKYTDYSNENPYQISCVTNTYDNWVTNKDNCPNGYIYSVDGKKERNCLVVKEWTINDYQIRYGPTCKLNDEKGGGSLKDKALLYLKRLNDFIDQNDQLIYSMKNGVDDLISFHNRLLELINLEMEKDNNTFLNFTLPFSMFLSKKDNMNDLFDCGLLKDDLIDFYDFTRNKLGLHGIIHMIDLLLIPIFNVMGIYFLIRILYVFNRSITEEDDDEDEDKEIPEINDKMTKNNKSNKFKNEKELLSVNKSNKNKLEKMSNKSKKTATGKVDNTRKGIKGTKSKVYLGLGKNKGSSSDETPSSSEKMRNNDSSEPEENETDENESEKKNNKDNKKKEVKDSETSNDDSDIESGIRDDGSAMS